MVLMDGFRGDRAGGSAEEEPLGCAGDAAQGTSPFDGTDGGVALLGERGGFRFFVGEVVLCGGEFGPASLTVEGEVVEWFEIGGREDGVAGARRFGSRIFREGVALV